MLAAIDHVGVAVSSIDDGLALFGDALGLELAHREVVEDQGVEAALLDVGGSHVELLAPLSDDTPVGKFLANKGPGLHHVAYRVDDINQTLADLNDEGVRMIDEVARRGIRNSMVAFVHPAATGGVLTELVQPAEDH
ncbi:MAG: methylmalonyl-CoA epimerase [Solirubrobacteraceae bacterium]